MPVRHHVRARRRHWAAPILLAGVLAATAGCGARWSDSQEEAVIARNTGGGAAGPSAARAGTDDPAVTDEALAPGDTVPGGPGVTTPGATPTPGPGGAPGPAAAGPGGPKPCAAPATAPGVTAKEIVLGSISTRSGAVPGLGASSEAAARAYIAFRNSTGGVCGRKLVLKTGDDGMDNGRYRALVSEFDKQVLGIIGGVGGGDAGGVDVVESRKIPIVSTPISEQMQNVSTVFDINPPFANPNAATAKYRFLKEQGATKAALVTVAADQTRTEMRKNKAQMVGAGMQIVLDQEVPLSTLSWDSTARQVANSGADYLFFVHDGGTSAAMAKSMRDTGHKLKFEEYQQAYGSSFIELAGAAAEGTSSWARSLPAEEPNSTPEQSAYLKWMGQTAPDSPTDVFAADSWSAAKAFIDALDALPGPITREALINQLRGVATYDAGGLLGPIELGPKRNRGCAIGMRVEGGKWKRFAPAKGFLC